jgi:hypothetical protein
MVSDYMSSPGRAEGAPPQTPRRRLDLALRWAGILLPLLLTYPLIPGAPWFGSLLSFQIRMACGAAIMVDLAATLLRCRDWRGAMAIVVFYVIADAYWWTLALGVIHID